MSTSARAVAQRNRDAMRTLEEKILDRAKAADRSAKYQLKRKIDKSDEHQGLAEEEKEVLIEAKYEELAERRYTQKKSGKL